MTLALVPADRLDLDSFARATGLHPELVRRLVALGLLEVVRDEAGNLWFLPGQVAAAYRLQRLRARPIAQLRLSGRGGRLAGPNFQAGGGTA